MTDVRKIISGLYAGGSREWCVKQLIQLLETLK